MPEAARRAPLDQVRRLFARRAGGDPPEAPGATLLALFEERGDSRVILIRRAIALAVHAGEIGLPGGRVEPGETMVAAALREADEEVGIDPSTVEVVGWLDTVTGRTTGSVVTPVVGFLDARPRLVAAPAEVEAVFDIGLSDLMRVYRSEHWGDRPMHFFELAEDVVWGLTARVLHQLLCEVTAVAPR